MFTRSKRIRRSQFVHSIQTMYVTGIIQFYLPTAISTAEAGTRFIDTWGVRDWAALSKSVRISCSVVLHDDYVPRLGLEPGWPGLPEQKPIQLRIEPPHHCTIISRWIVSQSVPVFNAKSTKVSETLSLANLPPTADGVFILSSTWSAARRYSSRERSKQIVAPGRQMTTASATNQTTITCCIVYVSLIWTRGEEGEGQSVVLLFCICVGRWATNWPRRRIIVFYVLQDRIGIGIGNDSWRKRNRRTDI